MKNFIFKSASKSDLYKILIKLDLLLTEQRHQRNDLHVLTKLYKIGRAMDDGRITAEDAGYTEDSGE